MFLKCTRNFGPSLFRWLLLIQIAALPGCSSWRRPGASNDADRLTRVIHTENARLKDLVVQLRSSNEDMAQRALDDAARITNLEESNRALSTSVAAYQAERERMARSFQTLQQQVQVVLSDRGQLAFQQDDGSPEILLQTISAESPQAPEGRINAETNTLSITLDDWFLPGTSILKDNQDRRLERVAKWLDRRSDHLLSVDYVGIKPQVDNFVRTASADTSNLELKKTSQSSELDLTRSKRLWDAVATRMIPENATKIRGLGVKNSTDHAKYSTDYPALVISFDNL